MVLPGRAGVLSLHAAARAFPGCEHGGLQPGRQAPRDRRRERHRRSSVWDAATGRETARLAAGHDAVESARWAPTGHRIALGFADGTLLVTDGSLRTPEAAPAGGQPGQQRGLQRRWSARPAGLTTGRCTSSAWTAVDPRVLKLTGNTGRRARRRPQPRREPRRERGCRRQRAALESGSDVGRVLKPADTPSETDVDVSPDDTSILAVGEDRRVRLFDARTGKPESSFNGQGRKLDRRRCSADGRRFATGGRMVVRVWTAGVGSPVVVLRGQRRAHRGCRLRAGLAIASSHRRGRQRADLAGRLRAGVDPPRVQPHCGLRQHRPERRNRQRRRHRARL